MPTRLNGLYEFGPFRLDASQKVLLKDGRPVELMPKTFDTLLVLVENAGRVVDKETFMRQVWPDAVVEEGGITSQISILRKLLGPEARLIETVPKRGYRFAGDVRHTAPGDASLVVQETHTFSRITVEEEEGLAEVRPSVAGDAARHVSGPSVKVLAARSTRTRAAVVVAVLALVSVVAVFAYRGLSGKNLGGRAPGALAVGSIAVLPFRALDGGSEDDYLRLGLADALTTRLSGVHRLTVRPTSAVLKYGDGRVEAAAAGRELRVDAVLAGSFQRAGQRVRVTMQLVDVRDGRALWSQTFDEELSNIFALQDSISEQVAGELAPQLSGEERTQLAKRHTQDLEADRLYWKGRLLMKQSVRTPETLRKAINYFKLAAERDPQFALAHADLAGAHESAAVLNLLPPREMFPSAREAVRKALELDPNLSEAHAVMGSIAWEYDYDWHAGERHLRRAIELNPSNASAHSNLAELLNMWGRHDEALAEIDRAQQIDPLSSNTQAIEALLLLYARRYEDAAWQAQATLELDPYSYLAHMYAAAAYEFLGSYDKAIEHVLKGRQLSGGAYPDMAMLARMHARSGREAEFKVAFKELQQLARREHVDPFAFVIVHEARRENSEALVRLEKSYEERSYWVNAINVNPHLDGLRGEPRFEALRERLRLPSRRAP